MVGEGEGEPCIGAVFTVQINTRHLQVHVFQSPFLVQLPVMVAYVAVGKPDIVDSYFPVRFACVRIIVRKAFYDVRKIEDAVILYDLDVRSG